MSDDTALMVSIYQDTKRKNAIADALYAFLCERSAQMGEPFTRKMFDDCREWDRDTYDEQIAQMESAIYAYELAITP